MRSIIVLATLTVISSVFCEQNSSTTFHYTNTSSAAQEMASKTRKVAAIDNGFVNQDIFDSNGMPDDPDSIMRRVKHISGFTTGTTGRKPGRAQRFPNAHGSPECKKLSGCIVVPNTARNQACFEHIRWQIYSILATTPKREFRPLEPIACAPTNSSSYCAFYRIVPFVAATKKDGSRLALMDTYPYRDMPEGRVPIKAIYEGMRTLKGVKTEVCGQAILPIPPSWKLDGIVYMLYVDVEKGIHSGDWYSSA